MHFKILMQPNKQLLFMQIQCNVFSGASGEVALTAAGGLRKIGPSDTYESPSLVQFLMPSALKSQPVTYF
jgi:hypothetical protein